MTTHPAGPTAPAGASPVTFHDHLLPGITAGRYRITVDQRLPAEDLPGARFEPVRQTVNVQAAQFRLDPSWVHAVYPAAHSQGSFHRLLPHITLDAATLPWQREPFTAGTRSPVRTPWLALLLFGEGELPGDPDALGATTSVTVGRLLTGDPAVSGPRLDPNAVDPVLLDTPCHVVDVPQDLLAQLLPDPSDLKYLAHVRVGGEDAAPAEGQDGPPAPDAYAVVTTARFPREDQGRYVAHLVSLEGHAPPLTSDGKPAPDGKHVRLVSLHHWTFTSCPTARDGFGRLAERFTPDNDEHSAAPLRPAPDPGTGLREDLSYLLEQGLVPMTHVTDSGERTLAWYSGPFLPRVAPELPRPADGHFPDADGLLLHEPVTGTFAVGYACAWNTGRALALADPGFATTLVRLRHRGRLRRATDRQYATYQRQLYGALPTGAVAGESPREVFEELLRGDAADVLATALGVPEDGPRPRAVPAAPVPPRRDVPRHAATPRTPSPDAVEAAKWLAGLRTLRGVPFDCLVPDQRMLPPESLRLFHVDRGWLDALLDGARSLDRNPDADTATDTELDELLAGHGPVPVAGLLLRSALVPGWPALRVEAHSAGTEPVRVIHNEVLGADVLLVLFDRVPHSLTISEPPQGLHFGTDEEGEVVLRRQGRGDAAPPPKRSVPAPMARPAGPRVLDVGKLAAVLARELAAEIAPRTAISPAEFAMQLVRAPEQLTLTFGGTRR
ncbi:hypothetical protein GUR47_20090 [Streptomyces tendae]|uniref:Uncharacterized protein n=1 Tax=Streptomyces tendae TaxID=1932 RepID=A0A6B3QLM4_STRTE|nr:hypothetical protein [Streptomyces tendae]NEV88953.1 hypothetical protein [Streptomyces tendae]